jgi:hypothetical protein
MFPFNSNVICLSITVKKNEFYQKFEKLPKEARFKIIQASPSPTSLFVLFQQLSQVSAQLRFFEMREKELLRQAEEGFKQINNGEFI